jgi:hypothetical protein
MLAAMFTYVTVEERGGCDVWSVGLSVVSAAAAAAAVASPFLCRAPLSPLRSVTPCDVHQAQLCLCMPVCQSASCMSGALSFLSWLAVCVPDTQPMQ